MTRLPQLPPVSHLALAGLCVASALGAGCVTEERIKGTGQQVKHYQQPDETNQTEAQLLEITEEHPKSPKAWWMLGDYYERMAKYPQALTAYQRMQEETQRVGKEEGLTFTGGLYLLGRVHARMRNWGEAVDHLQGVVAQQPKDLAQAVLNKHFAEAHYLLGAIYFEHRQWELAEGHLLTFRELTGHADHRADGMLIQVDDVLRPERAYGRPTPTPVPAKASASPGPEKGGTSANEGAPTSPQALTAPAGPASGESQ